MRPGFGDFKGYRMPGTPACAAQAPDIASTLHARNSDTKSSAGDNHEVGRAMVQQELDRSEIQRAKDIPDPVNIARLNALHPTANG